MSIDSSKRRALTILSALLFLFLNSCSSETARWQMDEIVSDSPVYQSKRLLHLASNRSTGFELEISQGQSDMQVHINVFSRQIPAYSGNPKRALITIADPSQSHNILAHRLKGGQRLRLGQEHSQLLLNSLKNSKEVKIYLEGYEENIDTEGFTGLFSRFPSPSSPN